MPEYVISYILDMWTPTKADSVITLLVLNIRLYYDTKLQVCEKK